MPDNPMEEKTTPGHLCSESALKMVPGQIETAVAYGARPLASSGQEAGSRQKRDDRSNFCLDTPTSHPYIDFHEDCRETSRCPAAHSGSGPAAYRPAWFLGRWSGADT
ncbi:hypothetical protein CFR80_14445 [Komagataeibacter oboediens]|uniref:Uncharacterized protein n=1 Tax=Komagataeibacter oboediens TaxID=65958 RepID=A0A318QQR8_9PROT|nr:hypothetical protein CFR80_14445 [Komagataeibacter oboediens]